MKPGYESKLKKKIPLWFAKYGINPIKFSLIIRAFTHPSFKGMVPEVLDYERLEFLGDSVLDLVAADQLFHLSGASEGILTEKRKLLVKNDNLAHIFDYLQIKPLILTAVNYIPSTKDKANFVESLFGAIYLDHGYEYCKEVWKYIYKNLDLGTESTILDSSHSSSVMLESGQIGQLELGVKNAKSMLQEFCQKQGLPIPLYQLIGRTGPDHAPSFQVELRGVFHANTDQAELRAIGKGSSKKVAEIKAAEHLCDMIGLHYFPSD